MCRCRRIRPAVAAVASVTFDAPTVSTRHFASWPASGGTQWNGIDIEFRNTLVGGDGRGYLRRAVSSRLIIDMADGADNRQHRASPPCMAEGTFRAELDSIERSDEQRFRDAS